METIREAKARKAKLASSDEIVVDQLKLNAKNKNTTKSTQTWLNVWEKWANERKFNPTSTNISIKTYKCFMLKYVQKMDSFIILLRIS